MRPYSEEELWELLRRVARELGRPPSQAEFWAMAGVHPETVMRKLRRYGRWRDLCRMAAEGRPLPSLSEEPADRAAREEELARQALAEVRARIGRTPGMRLYDAYRPEGAPSAKSIALRFGNGRWKTALERLGFAPSPVGPRPSPEDELLKALAALWRQLGREPATGDIDAAVAQGLIPGLASASTYSRRFGSVEHARQRARRYLEEMTGKGAGDA